MRNKAGKLLQAGMTMALCDARHRGFIRGYFKERLLNLAQTRLPLRPVKETHLIEGIPLAQRTLMENATVSQATHTLRKKDRIGVEIRVRSREFI